MKTKVNKGISSMAGCFIVILLLNLGSIFLEINIISIIYLIFVGYSYKKYKKIKNK